MKLKIYNSLTRNLDEFKPIEPGKVKMYSCGPTVYDFAHIGNFRAYVFSDLIHRTLRYLDYDVHLVMNITDVDDKTIKNSVAQKIPLKTYTKKYEESFKEDIEKLSILPARQYPAATDHVPEMIDMIKKLTADGHTYEVDGSIYFRISSFKDYGKLSNMDMEQVISGASNRTADDEYEKEEASDFVLWKAYNPKEGDVFWDTELGKGRPGWHIECSAMSNKYLGATFDIHTGGMDNKFPHHENEIAQSTCANHADFVHYWMHCSHLMVEHKKMSKSLNNFYTLRDILDKGYDPKAVRYLLISSHYRNHLNFTFDGLVAAQKSITKINHFIQALKEHADFVSEKECVLGDLLQTRSQKFKAFLCDDFNASGALGVLFELMHDFNKNKNKISQQTRENILDFLKKANDVFAVFNFDDIPQQNNTDIPPAVQSLLDKRQEARLAKNWALSDEIRDEILAKYNLIVKDSKEGQVVEPK